MLQRTLQRILQRWVLQHKLQHALQRMLQHWALQQKAAACATHNAASGKKEPDQ